MHASKRTAVNDSAELTRADCASMLERASDGIAEFSPIDSP